MLDTPARRGEIRLSTGSSLTIAALGVVYGDIGTSPLYAVRQSLVDFGDLSEPAVLGALSLIVWALALIVTIKYVIVIMRADNRGEGGRRRAVLRRRGHHPGDLGVECGRGAESRDTPVRALCDPNLARSADRPIYDAVARHGERGASFRPGNAGVVRRISRARHLGDRAAAPHPSGAQPILRGRRAFGRFLARRHHAGCGLSGSDRH